MIEKIAVIDENDNITGYEEKLTVHEKGLLHRAFSVFIINGDKMLIQKRALNKYHSAGLWTNACCSHQRQGEELFEAVHRRMQEELGFDCELKEVFSFIYKVQFENGLIEHELDHVFIGNYCKEVNPNPDEIEQIKWISLDDLSEMVKNNPQEFTYWFKQALPKVVKIAKH